MLSSMLAMLSYVFVTWRVIFFLFLLNKGSDIIGRLYGHLCVERGSNKDVAIYSKFVIEMGSKGRKILGLVEEEIF